MDIDERSVLHVLKAVFDYENFENDILKNATMAIYRGSGDLCISIPPGYSKSLCFQLPVLAHKDKIAIVFSPKLSFIKQEVDFLKSKEINACLLSKHLHVRERNKILKDLESSLPTIALLYVTPAIGSMEFFKKIIVSLRERSLLSYIVFNDAHCLSELSSDHIPCYKTLKIYDMVYEQTPRIAITTIVKNEVIEDICRVLDLNTPKIFTVPMQQLSIYYDVWFIDALFDPIIHLKNFITEVASRSDFSAEKIHNGFAIIYCREVTVAELLNVKLNSLGLSTLACHHKLPKSTRSSIETKWISGEATVIITTFDYGFVYAKTIRCVVYWTVPESITKYYRDCAQVCTVNGQTYCRIYFSTKEYSCMKLVIENYRVTNDIERTKRRLTEYNRIVSYCLSAKCRHVIINKYFGRITPPCKTNCDVCDDKRVVKIRTKKYITYAEEMEGVKFDICDLNEDVKEKQLERSPKQQLRTAIRTEFKTPETSSKEIIEGTNSLIKQYNISNSQEVTRKRSLSTSTWHSQKFEKTCVQTSMEDVMKYIKDTSDAIRVNKVAITQSLLDQNGLNNVISLELCTLKKNPKQLFERTTNTTDFSNEDILQNKSGPNVLSRSSKAKANKEEDRTSRRDTQETIVIGNERSDKKSGKRFNTENTCPDDFKAKRRKLYAEHKPITAANANGDGNVNSYTERTKDDTNGNASHDHAMLESIMNKYKLCPRAITLVPLRKKR